MRIKMQAPIFTTLSFSRALSVATFFVAAMCLAVSTVFAKDAHNSKGPVIEHWQTKNGAKVYFVAAPELPMVDVRVVFDGGGARDGTKPGLALLTNGLLAEGAGDLDATAIAKRFEDLGARFSNSSHRDMTVVSLRSLSDAGLLDPALDNLALILTKPSFPQESLERERKRLLIALQAEKESPGDISDKAFFETVYGDHPYAHPPKGSEASVNQLNRSDIVDFHRRYYVAKNAVVAIVGNLKRSQAEALAEKVVGGLAEGKPASPLPEVSQLPDAQSVRIEHPSQQTHILMGQPGMRREDADYFPLYVGNHILGGSGLVSRLSEEIREKRGLSYSTYSYFSPMRKEGPYTLGLQTRNDQATQALEVLEQVLRNFVDRGPSDDELKAAKQNITGSFPMRISSNTRIVEYISVIGFYGLPLDYLDRFNEHVEAVTVEQIRDAFKRRVNPDKMVTVVVGGSTS